MEPRKQAIITALRAFVRQRPGLEFANYGDLASYRAESRRIAMDKRHAETLLSAVAESDGITADMIVKASESAFSGRLTIKLVMGGYSDPKNPAYRETLAEIGYTTGQYFPTEYRKAVAAVCASALWYYVRDHGMPQVLRPEHKPGFIDTVPADVTPGDWLRAYFRREYGRAIAGRYFS